MYKNYFTASFVKVKISWYTSYNTIHYNIPLDLAQVYVKKCYKDILVPRARKKLKISYLALF